MPADLWHCLPCFNWSFILWWDEERTKSTLVEQNKSKTQKGPASDQYSPLNLWLCSYYGLKDCMTHDILFHYTLNIICYLICLVMNVTWNMSIHVVSLTISDDMAMKTKKNQKIGFINDPLVQIQSNTSSNHSFHLKIVLFCVILKNVNGLMYGHV